MRCAVQPPHFPSHLATSPVALQRLALILSRRPKRLPQCLGSCFSPAVRSSWACPPSQESSRLDPARTIIVPGLRAAREALRPNPLPFVSCRDRWAIVLPADLSPNRPRFVTARGQRTNGQQPRVAPDVSNGPLSGRFDLLVLVHSRLALKNSLRGSAPLGKPQPFVFSVGRERLGDLVRRRARLPISTLSTDS